MFVPDPRACRTRKAIGCGGDKSVFFFFLNLPQVEGGGGAGRGKKKRGEEKVDLPVDPLLAARALRYLLRLESPVPQGRAVEEAEKYVTGDRQVSARAGGGHAMVPTRGN